MGTRWDDVVWVARPILAEPSLRLRPHFLGAVAAQQTASPLGSFQERKIIEGDQRLATLQLPLRALEVDSLGAGIEPAAN